MPPVEGVGELFPCRFDCTARPIGTRLCELFQTDVQLNVVADAHIQGLMDSSAMDQQNLDGSFCVVLSLRIPVSIVNS